MIIQVAVRAMTYLCPQLGCDRARIGVMSVTSNPRRDTTGDGACRAEEGFRRRLVPLLTEQNIHQIPIPINGAIEVSQAPFDFDERLVDVPAAPDSPASMLAQCLAQEWSELGLPLPYRFVGKDQATFQEHFWQIPETQFVAHTPEHHETHDIGRVLQVVEARASPLIELPLASTTSKPSVA